MITGIYKIENKINHHVYIGQSVHIPKRWREHKNNAFNSNAKDYKATLYRAFRKYGLNNFSFEILEECTQDELNQKEVYWIQYYNSFNNGYNETEGGDESHIHLGKPIELYDYDGNYVTEYPSITEAAKALGVSRNLIYSILYGKRLSSKNYQFKLKEDKNTIIKKYSNRQGGKYKVYQCDENWNILNEYESVAEAARTLNIDSSSISKCCRGKLQHCGGYRWKYPNKKDEK